MAFRLEKWRRKTLIFQKIRSGTLKPNPSVTSEVAFVEDHHEKLKNLNQYTFYPEVIRARLLKNLIRRQRSFKPKKITFKSDRSEESICSSQKKSVFFKRPEFKAKQTFSSFVNSVVALSKAKTRKLKAKE